MNDSELMHSEKADLTELINQETARAIAYLKLAQAFRMPGADLAQVATDLTSTLAILNSAAHGEAVCLNSYLAGSSLHLLETEYTGLFLGPFHSPAPPYGSIYLEGKRQMMGDSTADARRHYIREGLDLTFDFKDAPDHVSTELEFMHVLICRSIEALDAADFDRLSALVDHQRLFLRCHIGAWMPSFTDEIIQHARTDFYRSLAKTAAGFIREEIETI